MAFLAEPGPSKGPFLERVDFGGDQKIVILGTESTSMSADNSINPCIKSTLAQTFAIWEGSGKCCFYRFPIGEKGVPKSMDETAGRLGGPKWPTTVQRRGPFWPAGPLGWPRVRAVNSIN